MAHLSLEYNNSEMES